MSLKEIKHEWRAITWPSKKETAQKTGIVIGFSAVFAAVYGLLDLGLYKLRALITGLFS